MKDVQQIVSEIFRLTEIMATDYPEIYKFLDENPITIPVMRHPRLDRKVLEAYLKDLKELMKHYVETHKAKPREVF
jgi:hypothetical protein